MKAFLLMVLLALTQCQHMSYAAQADIQEAEQIRLEEEAARMRGYRVNLRASYAELLLPPPLRDQQFEHYSSILNLSTAQEIQFRRLFDEHLETAWEYRQRAIQPLVDRSADLAELWKTEGTSSLRATETTMELFRDRTKTIQWLLTEEKQLVHRMVPYLTEEQMHLIDRVKNQRDRDLAIQFIIIDSPGVGLDLLKQIWMMERQGMDCAPSELAAFDSVVHEYDRESARLYRRLMEIQEETWGEVPYLLAQLRNISDQMKSRPALETAYADLRNQITDAERRQCAGNRPLHDLNKRYVETLATLLPAECGTELRRWFHEKSYPVVYPNPFEVQPILDELRSMDDLQDAQRLILQSIEQTYVEKRDAVSATMVSHYLDWHRLIEPRSLRYTPEEYATYAKTMTQLQDQRQKASEEVIGAIFATFDPSITDMLEPALQARESHISQYSKALEKRRSHNGLWPSPFD